MKTTVRPKNGHSSKMITCHELKKSKYSVDEVFSKANLLKCNVVENSNNYEVILPKNINPKTRDVFEAMKLKIATELYFNKKK